MLDEPSTLSGNVFFDSSSFDSVRDGTERQRYGVDVIINLSNTETATTFPRCATETISVQALSS
jgi:hypothetical protein